MNDLQKLHQFLVMTFPDVRFDLAKPRLANGFWGMDAYRGEYHLYVEWKEGKGFGITSDEDHGYGEGADEIYDEYELALSRSVQLLMGKLPTEPPPAVKLREIREKAGVAQQELTSRMGVRQGTVSRLEARSDHLASTLREFAGAMGAKLSMRMIFPDAKVVEIDLEPGETADGKA